MLACFYKEITWIWLSWPHLLYCAWFVCCPCLAVACSALIAFLVALLLVEGSYAFLLGMLFNYKLSCDVYVLLASLLLMQCCDMFEKCLWCYLLARLDDSPVTSSHAYLVVYHFTSVETDQLDTNILWNQLCVFTHGKDDVDIAIFSRSILTDCSCHLVTCNQIS